jgi:hypothetical protein
MLVFAASVTLSSVQHILLDGSNLQLNLRPGGAALNLCHIDCPELPAQLDAMTKLFSPAASVTAIFDGASFDGVHANACWTCEPEVPNATPLRVQFTAARESADDVLVDLAQSLGAAADSSPSKSTSSGHVRHLLEQPLPDPKPVFAATLLKSAMGKSRREKREAFFKTCGLQRMGDTVHLPAYLPAQQERSLGLVRGLHSIERGVLSFAMISQPSTLLVSDDRGLRRRCFALPNPPVVLGRNQFFNMMRQAVDPRWRVGEDVLVSEEPVPGYSTDDPEGS